MWVVSSIGRASVSNAENQGSSPWRPAKNKVLIMGAYLQTTKICFNCKKDKPVTDFYLCKKSSYSSWCKECHNLARKQYRKDYYQNNKDKMKANTKRYRKDNHDSILAKEAIYRRDNKEILAERGAEYHKNNPTASRTQTAKYRAVKLQRTPQWANVDKIKEIYLDCGEINNMARIVGSVEKFVVDHIIPLLGENVSGLHVENNLQIITDSENARKGNKFTIK